MREKELQSQDDDDINDSDDESQNSSTGVVRDTVTPAVPDQTDAETNAITHKKGCLLLYNPHIILNRT